MKDHDLKMFILLLTIMWTTILMQLSFIDHDLVRLLHKL